MDEAHLSRALEGIARDVLKIEHPIDPATSVFALGASSLQAIALVERIRRELGIEISVFAFVEHPTIAGVVRHVAEMQSRGPSTDAEEEGTI